MPEPIRVMAMGDSHFERGSPLVRFLERDLGMNYRVVAAGRRGWTSGMWRSRIWQWRAISRRADIILISLSGNDRSNNIPASIFKPNIDESLLNDAQGKTYGQALLLLEVELPDFLMEYINE